MPSAKIWDLAIVGGGPAGASLAIETARSGLQVVLVDTARFPRQKVCGEYLSAAAWRQLEELGLGNLQSRSVPLSIMRLTANENCGVEFSFAPPHLPRVLSRYTLDARLIDEAARAGAAVLTGQRVRRVIVENGRATAIDCGDEVDHQRATQRIAARLIVAADGRRSVVVRDTGYMNRRAAELVGFKRHVRPREPLDDGTIAMHALPGGYVGTCVTEDGMLNVCGCVPRRLIQTTRGDVAAALDAWLVDRPTLRAQVAGAGDGPWHSIPDISLQSARPGVSSVLYIGDAQGTIEPLTGQGMTIALASARLAAQIITRYGVDGITEVVQQAYFDSWRSMFARPIASAAWFGRLLCRPALLRAVITAGRPLPGLTDLLLRGAHRRTLTSPA
jgi:flavin-dependent dehydrogenase